MTAAQAQHWQWFDQAGNPHWFLPEWSDRNKCWMVRDARGALRWNPCEAERRVRRLDNKLWKITASFCEDDNWARINLFPQNAEEMAEWCLTCPQLNLERLAEGRSHHLTLTLQRNAANLTAQDQADLQTIRTWFQQSSWRSYIRLWRTSSFTADGGFVAILWESGFFQTCPAVLAMRRLRGGPGAHGPHFLTVSF